MIIVVFQENRRKHGHSGIYFCLQKSQAPAPGGRKKSGQWSTERTVGEEMREWRVDERGRVSTRRATISRRDMKWLREYWKRVD